MEEYINKQYLYAVIGANSHPASHGIRVLNALKDRGYKVIGISPYSDEINGIKCFESILDFDDRPDVIIVATPPLESREVVQDCIDFGLDKFWFQPDCCTLEIFTQLQTEGMMMVCDRDICVEL